MFIVEAVKPVCTHDGGCPYAAERKHSNLKGGIDVLSAIPQFKRLFEKALSLLVNRRSGINRFCKKYRIWCDMTT